MSTPKDMRGWNRTLPSGDQIHVYSDARRILLQLRRAVPTTDDVLAPSFKVAVELGAHDTLALAIELLTAVTRMRCQGPENMGNELPHQIPG